MISAQTIGPVDPDAMRSELTPERFVRRFRDLEIYVVEAANAPSVMDEIGRIREVEFRLEGGGTGKPKDIDEFDTEYGFKQLIAWDPVNLEIVAAYRFLRGSRALRNGEIRLPTARLFDFSDAFVGDVLPATIELGRSVVNRRAKKKIHGLYAVWSGLGAIIAEMPGMRFFFGKVTSYADFDVRARSALFHVLYTHFGDSTGLVVPKPGLTLESEPAPDEFTARLSGTSFKRDYTELVDYLSSIQSTMPPLFVSYTGLSDTLRVFGTARNPHFGNVYETAMMITIDDIHQKHRDRFIGNYESVNPGLFL